MIPGTTTKLSESSVVAADKVAAKSDILIVTTAGTINTILPNFGGGQFSGLVILLPTIAGVILGTAGNVAVGATLTVNRPILLVFVKSLGKWYIHTVV